MPAVADELGADLDQLLAQRGDRPTLGILGPYELPLLMLWTAPPRHPGAMEWLVYFGHMRRELSDERYHDRFGYCEERLSGTWRGR